ncbi:MAG: NAD(P)H-dependent glycerol-3-phosphate dehydrogenase [Candidatus Omnitrophota bacterium]
MTRPSAVTIIGAGNWGTTLAVLLSGKGLGVCLHSVFKDHNSALQNERQNKLFLKGVKFPSRLKIEPSLKDALGSEIIVIAVPVRFINKVLKKIKSSRINLSNKIFVSVSKGIEVKSLKRVSELIRLELGNVKIAVLSGPNIAWEVVKEIPTASVIASANNKVAEKLQVLFSTSSFRVYKHRDIVGIELAGALKNIIAIACGISDGLGFGSNTKAALVTRGLVEITRLGKVLGAETSTFSGLSGLGDVVTTCFSPHSRNRTLGEKIGNGKRLKAILKEMKEVAEGIETVKSAYCLSRKFAIDMPITEQVYAVLYRNKSPKRAVCDLMGRPLKLEKS